jgi:hypothetical protein
MDRRAAVATITAAVVGAAGAAPALASPGKAKPKPLKGKWSFTDVTADPSVTALGLAGKRQGYCVGELPAASTDVNSHPIKVAGKGTLEVAGSTTGDWAMEVRDAKGRLLAGSDGGKPQDQEGTVVPLAKAGTYTVIYCNLTGAPTATATYTYRYR